ncbi:MAG: FRG domain-containing protein [Hylemonella sp.]|uniref:FRG domain-containing protein n=1 Tax=Hylemonella sp. TaxID=2066020 RepID=UPI0022BEE239|nr:FRG domain-containing protein [Hylemonella sp.]MCZ8252174.1 FRG domain-containing protein [Hylemonella sp.]
MRFGDRQITSISDLLAQLTIDRQQTNDSPMWFRGQTNAAWNLQPKVLRGPNRPEWDIIGRFQQNATLLVERNPTSDFDWLFLIQHYGGPTRLLDWSESPLIALWFAIHDDNTEDQPAAVWCLLPTVLNQYANFRAEFDGSIPSFADSTLNSYSPTSLQQEKRSHLIPMAAIASRNNRRIQAQQGVFTISHRAEGSVDNLPQNYQSDHVWRYVIPADAKTTFKSQLKSLGFSKFQLFPELPHALDGV